MNYISDEPSTKMIVTMGPASCSAETVGELIEAGADVFRLNFSHGSHENHKKMLETVREQSRKAGRPVAILQDLSGTKIRLGKIPDGPVSLVPGAAITLTTRDVEGSLREVSINYDKLPREVREGDLVLVGDGAVELEVGSINGGDIACKVVVGGEINSGKGVAVPGRDLSAGALTAKDEKDLEYGIGIGVDMVALSFVRGPEDIEELRSLMRKFDVNLPIIAKIERHECVANLESVIDASDGVMVARGDLGVDVPIEQVPMLQKQIVEQARYACKPVIIATQMLRSMVESRRPTRAEATDVANAVLDGTDAIMLSEETSVGRYPAESVRMMRRIAREAEKALVIALEDMECCCTADAISESAYRIALDIDARAIVVPTFSGSSAVKVARFRPPVPIIALSPCEETLKQLCLVWGVIPRQIDPFGSVEEVISSARNIGREVCGRDGRIVLTAGLPLGEPGRTNLIKVVDLS